LDLAKRYSQVFSLKTRDLPKEAAMKANHKFLVINIFLSLVLVAGLLGGTGAAASSAAQASYIIQGLDQASLTGLVARYGGVVTSNLEIINGVGATLPAGAAAKIAAEPGVSAVTANATVGVSDDKTNDPKTKLDNAKAIPNTDYPNLTGATVAWKAGVTGKGVSVAVVDTGISLVDGLGKNPNSNNAKVVAWKDFVGRMPIPVDPNGHGTHVAGIIANSQKGPDGDFNGMAPDANLVGVRVLDDQGYGTYEHITAGIRWVVQNKKLITSG